MERGLRAAIASGMALLAALSSPGCRAKSRPSRRVVLEKRHAAVELGLGGAWAPGCWNVLRVRARNSPKDSQADFRGSLEVQGFTGPAAAQVPDPVSYRQAVELPRDETPREFTVLVRPEGWTAVRATFRQEGFERSFDFEDLKLAPAARLRLLSVSSGGVDLSALESWLEEEAMGAFGVTPADVGALPLRACALAPFALVVLQGVSLVETPLGAVAALRRWVEAGGSLVVFPGPKWAAGIPEPLAALLGVTDGDPRAALPRESAAALGEAGAGFFYRELHPAEGAEVVAGGIAIRARVGAGTVTTFTVGPQRGSFPIKAEAPALYAALEGPVARSRSFAGRPAEGLRAIESEVRGLLHAMSEFRVPTPEVIAGGLLVYLALGFAVPGLIFRRLGRQEWTFAALIAVAGLLVVGIIRYGLLSAMEAAEIEEFTLLRVHADGRTAEATSYLGFIAPHLKTVHPDPDEGPASRLRGGALPTPLPAEIPARSAEPPASAPGVTLEAGPGPGLRHPPLTLYPHAMRFIRYDYQASLEGLISIDLESRERPAPADRARFLVKNQSAEPLEALLLSDGSLSPLMTMGPGSEERFEVAAGPGPKRRPARSSPPESGPKGLVLSAIDAPGRRGPAYFVALLKAPVFPEVRGMARRKAWTAIVLEIPGESRP